MGKGPPNDLELGLFGFLGRGVKRVRELSPISLDLAHRVVSARLRHCGQTIDSLNRAKLKKKRVRTDIFHRELGQLQNLGYALDRLRLASHPLIDQLHGRCRLASPIWTIIGHRTKPVAAVHEGCQFIFQCARNDALEDTPEMVNQSPYETGWLIKVKMSDPAEADNLMTAQQYEQTVGESSE